MFSKDPPELHIWSVCTQNVSARILFFSESTYCSIQYAYRSMCCMRESLWFFPEWLLCLDQPLVGCVQVHLLPKMYKAQFSYYDNWRFSFRTHCVCDSKRNVDILVPFMNKRWMISLFNKSRRALVESYSVLWEWRNWMCVLNEIKFENELNRTILCNVG